MKNLSILIVEDDQGQAVNVERVLDSNYLEPHHVNYYFAKDHEELVDRLQSLHCDIAVVDFDLNESGNWMLDAAETAFKISKYQPSCFKVGLSFSGVLEAIRMNDSFNLEKLYLLILERGRFLEGEYRELLRERFKQAGL